MLDQTGVAFFLLDQSDLQEDNECGPCLLMTTTSQVCGWFKRAPAEGERRMRLAVAIYSANVDAVLGVMDPGDFESHRQELKDKLDDVETVDCTIICDRIPTADAARFKRIGSSDVCARDLRELMTCGSFTKGSSLALPCLALPCLALPCLALPCLALPCLALPCLALPCLALPCLALPFPAP